MVMKLIFISAVCGVGKSTTCEYIKTNNLLDNYEIFDIDDLVNVHTNKGNIYENAIKRAIELSNNKDIILGSCVCHAVLEKFNMPQEIESYKCILITCSNEELIKRLKDRDKNRNCSSDEFINGQIEYQNYLLNHSNLFQLHVDNTNTSIEEVANQIVDFVNKKIK
jgi:broad-specificity NMP kinase